MFFLPKECYTSTGCRMNGNGPNLTLSVLDMVMFAVTMCTVMLLFHRAGNDDPESKRTMVKECEVLRNEVITTEREVEDLKENYAKLDKLFHQFNPDVNMSTTELLKKMDQMQEWGEQRARDGKGPIDFETMVQECPMQ